MKKEKKEARLSPSTKPKHQKYIKETKSVVKQQFLKEEELRRKEYFEEKVVGAISKASRTT